MIISIIAAMANNRVIGNKNSLPWNLPADLEHFKELTIGKPVIMGQRTFESIGKPLPGRTNIILTKDDNFQPQNGLPVKSVQEAIKTAEKTGAKEAMICGGASIYSQFLPLAHKMYLTLIEGDFQGDVFFPEFDWSDWKEAEKKENLPNEQNPYKYTFITLEKIWTFKNIKN